MTTTSVADAAVSESEGAAAAALELQYFKANSLYRRRNYEKCAELCNEMLQAGHADNVQIFASPPEEDEQQLRHGGVGGGSGSSFMASGASNRYSSSKVHLQRAGPRLGRRQAQISQKVVMPTWMMEGVWQLKMRALTQRVYVDDLETNDDGDAANEEIEFERIATAARPGTSIKTAFVLRPGSSALRSRSGAAQSAHLATGGQLPKNANSNRTSNSSKSARPTSGMARPGTALARPGSSLGGRPASRCGTASATRVRATSAAAFAVGDATAPLYQASRLNPTIYAERQVLVKALFQFLFYHECDVPKAHSLCEAVMQVQKQKEHAAASNRSPIPDDWWWHQQMGRCLLAMRYPRKAESYLQHSLSVFPHPDTYLLLSRLYQRLDAPERALELITSAADQHPFDVTYRTEQGRILVAVSKPDDAMQIYRLIAKLNPINIEALASIAVNYFYDNNPEMALMYYRRILSLGVHTSELYCNIALCCLYGGQIDLVLPCFQRALLMAKTGDQKADIWYNLSFVAITTGDFNLARRCLQLSLTSDAGNGAALNNLAVLSAHTGDLMKARSYLNAAKEVLTESEEISNNLQYIESNYKL